MEITKKQIEKLKESYEDNKNVLKEIKRYIQENGIMDNGLDDVTESFEQGWNNALEFVFSTLGIKCVEDNKNEIINEDSIIEEICPHCDYINRLNWDGQSRTMICKDCGEEILLCCLCDMDECDCNNCPYKK